MKDFDETIAQVEATSGLYQTNLLRIQAKELLDESILNLSSHTGELDREVKWADQVRNYLDSVKKMLQEMEGCMLSPDIVTLSHHSSSETTTANQKSSQRNRPTTPTMSGKDEKQYFIQLQSDFAYKHFHPSSGTESTERWEFPFPGGSALEIVPVYSYAAHGAGLTTRSANANVVPIVDLAVLMPVSVGEESPAMGMIGDKDYMNGRYFDKRNILAIYIAKYLSQKKQRKSIGAVHLVHDLHGDFRRVSLLLTPPLDNGKDRKREKSDEIKPKGKRAKLDTTSHVEEKRYTSKGSRTRFRVRLVLGCQTNVNTENIGTNGLWIPRARLFPNRINNKYCPELQTTLLGSDSLPTPTYTSSIVEDMNHVKITEILSHTAQEFGRSFTESWTLIKVWCLQRGFLRGEDTLSEVHIGLLLVYLYRTKLISSRMDCIHIFTVWLKFMADTDWLGEDMKNRMIHSKNDTIRHSDTEGYRDFSTVGANDRKIGLVLPLPHTSEKQTMVECVQNRLYLSDYKETSARLQKTPQPTSADEGILNTLMGCFKNSSEGPIFLDSTMTLNFFSRVSVGFMREMQLEAHRSLNCIHGDSCHAKNWSSHGGGLNPFRYLFLEHVRFWKRHDIYVQLRLDDIKFPSKKSTLWGNDIYDYGLYGSITRGLNRVLRLALSDRVTRIRVLTTGNGEVGHDTKTLDHSIDVEDLGVTILQNTDQSYILPIRAAHDKSEFYGYRLGKIVSPVAIGMATNPFITIGICVNPGTCHRIVDRGPPADDNNDTAKFLNLWGEEKAQLRRFKDGAIVHAVIWNEADRDIGNNYFKYEGDEKLGGIVERITKHIISFHFHYGQNQVSPINFALRDMLRLIEGISDDKNITRQWMVNSCAVNKEISSSFDTLSHFLKQHSSIPTNSRERMSKLGLPLSIEAVEALSPCLRGSQLFPPVPHPLLGVKKDNTQNVKMAGAILGQPILIQIRLESSPMWPSDIRAMGAAKCAMLIQLATGIEKIKNEGLHEASDFDGPINVTQTYMDVGYRGFVWRIIIRADQEMTILESLPTPSQDAVILYQALRERHVLSSVHHYAIRSICLKFPAAGPTVRLAQRWIAAHMLSDLFPVEAVELLVASLFTNRGTLDCPGTVPNAFLRFLSLLGTHDWLRQPLIVDPNDEISVDDKIQIHKAFESSRGLTNQGPAMYLVSYSEFKETVHLRSVRSERNHFPVFTKLLPERVILTRAAALARRSYEFVFAHISGGDFSSSWSSIFQESQSSLMTYSALFRLNTALIVDTSCSSMCCDISFTTIDDGVAASPYTRAMTARSLGLKSLQLKNYRNLKSANNESLMYSWRPVETLVSRLREKFGHLAVFFYNELTPNVVAVLWRPSALAASSFSALNSEFKRPVESDWKPDSLVVTNGNDVLREIYYFLRNAVIDVKIIDVKSVSIHNRPKRQVQVSSESDQHSEDDNKDEYR